MVLSCVVALKTSIFALTLAQAEQQTWGGSGGSGSSGGSGIY